MDSVAPATKVVDIVDINKKAFVNSLVLSCKNIWPCSFSQSNEAVECSKQVLFEHSKTFLVFR